jgi:hypothetical protein
MLADVKRVIVAIVSAGAQPRKLHMVMMRWAIESPYISLAVVLGGLDFR